MKPPVVAHQSPDRVACVADRGHAEAFDEGLGDLRFRALLSAADWDLLPPTVRWRFTLDFVHPRVGGLIRQAAIFREAAP